MNRNHRFPRTRWAAVGIVAALTFGASGASARTETLRWLHPQESDVQYFRIHWGTSPGSYASSVAVGRPRSGEQFVFAAEVPDDARVYFAVSAVGTNGLESSFSNEIVRNAPATPEPPQPPPEPPATSLGQPGRPQIVR